jgi:CrcB protein
MERLLWICLGGAAGSGARYLIALWAAQRFGSAFPVGTLIVNLVGCFTIAGVMHAAATLSWSATLRSAIVMGFVGGFTRYSSFYSESSRLFDEGAAGAALLNVAATLFGAFAAGWLGMASARLLLGR